MPCPAVIGRVANASFIYFELALMTPLQIDEIPESGGKLYVVSSFAEGLFLIQVCFVVI